jgi:AcrR family transcriptional regulator
MDKIKLHARAQLAERGAAALSLREVAREMGQTSSALYRYFPSRDDLLTALIVDAYNDLGASVERAERRVAREDHMGRWRAAAGAIRRWARAHPHEYALIFGSPVPGYEAPELTIEAATRVTLVIATIVADRWRDAAPEVPDVTVPPRALLWDAVELAMPGVPRAVALQAILVWVELFGFVSFELFGHLVGSADRADDLFSAMVDDAGRRVGLASAPRSRVP